jgi:hypothetical protein
VIVFKYTGTVQTPSFALKNTEMRFCLELVYLRDEDYRLAPTCKYFRRFGLCTKENCVFLHNSLVPAERKKKGERKKGGRKKGERKKGGRRERKKKGERKKDAELS